MFHFEIYNYSIYLDCSLPKVEDRIRKDFSYFTKSINSISTKPQLIIRNHQLSSAPQKSGFPLWKTRMCQVFQSSWHTRSCVYKVEGQVAAFLQHHDFIQFKEVDIYCDNEDLFCEIVHMLILSSCGEYLEEKGVMRLHAAVLLYKDKPFVFWGPRGAGKSTLAYQLMNLLEIKILTDEHGIVDLKSGQLLPFPLRLALDTKLSEGQTLRRIFLDQKSTLEIPVEKRGPVTTLDKFVVLGDRSNDLSDFKVLTFFQKLNLFFHIVLGTGLIQMSEFMLRPTNISSLIKIFINRVRLFSVILKADLSYWSRSPDLQVNLLLCQQQFRGL